MNLIVKAICIEMMLRDTSYDTVTPPIINHLAHKESFHIKP